MRTFAKKREPICAAQWTGEMTPEITELLGAHLISVDKDELVFANVKGPGRFARKGDWIGSSSGEDLFVIGDAQFRKIYEEVDGTRDPCALGDAVSDQQADPKHITEQQWLPELRDDGVYLVGADDRSVVLKLGRPDRDSDLMIAGYISGLQSHQLTRFAKEKP